MRAHDRHLRALELRKAGATYQQIADELGYSGPRGAHKAVASALKATLKEPADEVRALELARLDAALLAIWQRVRRGDEKAIDRLLSIMKRRMDLLGLAAPKRHHLSGVLATLSRDDVDLKALSREELEMLEALVEKLDASHP